LLVQLAECGDVERLPGLDRAGDRVPVAAALGRAVRDEELVSATHVDQYLRPLGHAGKTTSARAPAKAKLPCSSSATSARTIESTVTLGAPSVPGPSLAMALR